jgi:hypothetical protein
MTPFTPGSLGPRKSQMGVVINLITSSTEPPDMVLKRLYQDAPSPISIEYVAGSTDPWYLDLKIGVYVHARGLDGRSADQYREWYGFHGHQAAVWRLEPSGDVSDQLLGIAVRSLRFILAYDLEGVLEYDYEVPLFVRRSRVMTVVQSEGIWPPGVFNLIPQPYGTMDLAQILDSQWEKTFGHDSR